LALGSLGVSELPERQHRPLRAAFALFFIRKNFPKIGLPAQHRLSWRDSSLYTCVRVRVACERACAKGPGGGGVVNEIESHMNRDRTVKEAATKLLGALPLAWHNAPD
jgi:hypothetical protein